MSWDSLVHSVLGTCLSTFGEAVLHETPDGLSYARSGIFNDTFKTVDAQGFEVISHQPNLGIRVADWVPLFKEGDRIIRRGVSYWVRHFEKDGEGGGTIILDKRAGISGHAPLQFDTGEFSGEFQ